MKTCLIVGASSAIGAGAAKLLVMKGWRCILSSSQPEQEGFKHFIDFTQPATITTAVQSIPLLNGVVICAGIEPQQSLTEMEGDHLNRMLAIHVTGPILLLQALERKMRAGSSVVLMSSVAAYRGSYDPAYAAAKGAVVALTRSLARAWGPRVRVNALAPGLIYDTPVFKRMTEDFRQRHENSTLLQRIATVDDCSSAIEFLLTHKHLTGVILHMNGGQYCA